MDTLHLDDLPKIFHAYAKYKHYRKKYDRAKYARTKLPWVRKLLKEPGIELWVTDLAPWRAIQARLEIQVALEGVY